MDFFESQFTWWQMLKTAVWLTIVYFVLKLILRWLALGRVGGAIIGWRIRQSLQNGIHRLLTLFEPAAMLLLGAGFVFINPALHGTMLLIILIVAFSPLKSYFEGRFMLLSESFAAAERIETKGGRGQVERFGRLGVYLRTGDGLMHVPYNVLRQEGFTLVSGEDTGQECRLEISYADDEKKDTDQLRSMLSVIPYIKKDRAPDIRPLAGAGYEVRVVLYDQEYIPYLPEIAKEWGWKCSVK